MAEALMTLWVLRYTRTKPPADRPAPSSSATTNCRQQVSTLTLNAKSALLR